MFDQGLLEAALVDGESLGDEITLSSGKVLSKATLKNPVICIANYVFNTLSHDALQVQPDGVYVASVQTKSTAAARLNINNEMVDSKPFEIIQGMSNRMGIQKQTWIWLKTRIVLQTGTILSTIERSTRMACMDKIPSQFVAPSILRSHHRYISHG